VCGLEHPREALIQTFGIPLREAMVRLMSRSKDAEAPTASAVTGVDMVEQLLLEYRHFNTANHDMMAQPFEGIERVVRELRERGYLIGVVTSKGRELGLRGLKLCSLDLLIDAAVFLEDTVRHKPEPEPILAALERLNVTPERAAYVGDSCHDIVAGRAAGVRTVAALWGPMPRTELECAEPDYLAESVAALLEIFERP
jgi:pyrophosphatase PpaX